MIRQLFFIFLLFWQVVALAQDSSLLLEQAYLEDSRADLMIEQASTSDFQTYQGNLSLGYQPGAVWTRLKIAKAGDEQDNPFRRVAIRVGPNYLDRIELYWRSDNRWNQQSGGALAPQGGRDCPDDMRCFDVDAPATEAATVYLRLQHRGFMTAQIEVLTSSDLPFAVAKRVRGITMSVLVAAALLVLGLTFLFIDRSLLLLAYCSFQLTVVLFIASNAGLLARVFPAAAPELLSTFNSFLYVLRAAVTGLLAWAILHPHRPTRLFVRIAKATLILCGLNGLLIFTGDIQLGLQACLLAYSIIPFSLLYGIWSAPNFPVNQRRVLTAGIVMYILLLTVGLWFSFMGPSWLPASGPIRQLVDWRLNGLPIGIVFFWLTMLERSSQQKTRAIELNILRQQASQAQTTQSELEDRSALIDMLTHELKNPLGTVRFALASLKQQALGNMQWLKRIQSIDLSVRRMDDLVERVAHFTKMERATATENPAVIDSFALIQELLSEVTRPEQWNLQVEKGATFRSDRQLLVVILENLMTNASKYSLPHQKIRIEVTVDKTPRPSDTTITPGSGASSCTRFEISNQVDPTSAPDEHRLFERYYRHPNAHVQPGMGLGLNVVKTVAHKIGGQVSYRHENNQVFFTLRVPA